MSSRRAADELISSGAVLVNGDRPPAAGMLIDPGRDRITVLGKVVRPATTHRYVALHKPIGYITTSRDESGRRTVLDLVGDAGADGHRLFAVGRLDADSTGLLLLTDDGELAFRLTHPRYHVAKEYVATVAGELTPGQLASLRSGVQLSDGITAPAEVETLGSTRGPRDSGRTEVRIVLREGRNRQVRRMLLAIGHRVIALKRTAFGPLRLGRMRAGAWRALTQPELAALRKAAGLDGPRRPDR